MKKKFSLILSLVMVFTVLLGFASNPKIAKADSAPVHYDDVLVGTKNLNNTASNSAKIGNILLEPEIGWKRYDDTNSMFRYDGVWHFDTTDATYNTKFYKNTRSFANDFKESSVQFVVNAKKIRIIGFSSNNSGDISLDSVYVDNVKVGSLADYYTYGKQNCLAFEYTFNTSGAHYIKISNPSGVISTSFDAIDIDSNGQLIDVNSLPARMNVEAPQAGNTYIGSFDLSGWAINQSGIKGVKTYIDDAYSRDTQIGISRLDVGNAYPSYLGANTSGFITTYKVSDFTVGYHTLKVQAIGNDGTTQEVILYLYVYDNKIIVKDKPLVPFFRYNNGKRFYTTNYGELGSGQQAGFQLEGIACFVFPTQQPGTIPLYRYQHGDHFYTTDSTEQVIKDRGYISEGIACYVYKDQMPGTVPLYRYANADNTDHFYTTSYSEIGDGSKYGYHFERIECYVYPNN